MAVNVSAVVLTTVWGAIAARTGGWLMTTLMALASVSSFESVLFPLGFLWVTVNITEYSPRAVLVGRVTSMKFAFVIPLPRFGRSFWADAMTVPLPFVTFAITAVVPSSVLVE